MDPSGHFTVRRWMVAVPIDALMSWAVGPAYAPIKKCVKSYMKGITKKALKKKLTSNITKFIRRTQCKLALVSKTVGSNIRKVLGIKKKPVRKYIVQNKIWEFTSAAKIRNKIYHSIYNQSVGSLVNNAVENLDTISSVGVFFCRKY